MTFSSILLHSLLFYSILFYSILIHSIPFYTYTERYSDIIALFSTSIRGNSLWRYLEDVIEGEPGEEDVRHLLAQREQGEHDPVGHPPHVLLHSRHSIDSGKIGHAHN